MAFILVRLYNSSKYGLNIFPVLELLYAGFRIVLVLNSSFKLLLAWEIQLFTDVSRWFCDQYVCIFFISSTNWNNVIFCSLCHSLILLEIKSRPILSRRLQSLIIFFWGYFRTKFVRFIPYSLGLIRFHPIITIRNHFSTCFKKAA